MIYIKQVSIKEAAARYSKNLILGLFYFLLYFDGNHFISVANLLQKIHKIQNLSPGTSILRYML